MIDSFSKLLKAIKDRDLISALHAIALGGAEEFKWKKSDSLLHYVLLETFYPLADIIIENLEAFGFTNEDLSEELMIFVLYGNYDVTGFLLKYNDKINFQTKISDMLNEKHGVMDFEKIHGKNILEVATFEYNFCERKGYYALAYEYKKIRELLCPFYEEE